MTFINIILGILMILAGCSILSVPAFSGIIACWIMSAAMLVAGIFAIIHFIEAKNAEKVAEKNGLVHVKTGIGSLLFGIAAIVLSIIANSSEEGSDLFTKIVTVIFGVWIILDGVSFFKHGLEFKKIAAPGWLVMIIMGILTILAGIACIIFSFVSLTAIGTFYGIGLMMFGFSMILNN